MTNYRWTICAMLFFATTVNYLDRQVLSLTWDEFIKPEFHWNEVHYGTITSVFSIVYAICMLFAGRFIDWMGTKKGYLWAIGVWSAGACMHALCGIVTEQYVGLHSAAELMAATGDRVPCVWMENQQVLNYDPSAPIEVSYTKPFPGEPTGKNNPELLTNLKPSPNHGHNQAIVNGISRIGYMKGGGKALWKDEDIADTIIAKTVGFIERNSDKPFFLYVGTNDVHVPRFPHPRFVGKSGMGYRGDAILQFDYTVGKILEALEKQGLRENTLIVLSSDNGPVVDDGYQDQAVELLGDHRPWGNLRGGKYSNFEAGTRVPFIVSWPDKVKKGKTSDALVSQIDLFASMAELVGQEMQPGAGVDSQNQLKAFLGTDRKGRDYVIEASGSLSVSDGAWKYITPNKGAAFMKLTRTETGNAPVDQLYNLKKDRGEKENLAEKYPEKVKAMKAILEREKANTK